MKSILLAIKASNEFWKVVFVTSFDSSINPCRLFDSEAIKALQKRSWKGNIRELRNVVERLIILSPSPISAVAVEQFA